MTPQEQALLGSAQVIGWTLLPPTSTADTDSVVLTRRTEDRVEVLSYRSITGTAVVRGEDLDGRPLWRHEVPAMIALFWATSEVDDDAPLAEYVRSRDAVRDPGTP